VLTGYTHHAAPRYIWDTPPACIPKGKRARHHTQTLSCSSDGKGFRVHQLILSLPFPFFRMLAALSAIAYGYDAEVVKGPFRDMLVPHFLKKSPLRIHALASRWGFEEEARIVSRTTLRIVGILAKFPRRNAELMGGASSPSFESMRSNQALVDSNLRSSPNHSSCRSPPPTYANFRPALC